MADENDPNGPEDAPPPPPPQGDEPTPIAEAEPGVHEAAPDDEHGPDVAQSAEPDLFEAEPEWRPEPTPPLAMGSDNNLTTPPIVFESMDDEATAPNPTLFDVQDDPAPEPAELAQEEDLTPSAPDDAISWMEAEEPEATFADVPEAPVHWTLGDAEPLPAIELTPPAPPFHDEAPALPEPTPPPPPDPSQLPPNYFRAAGDPDELPPDPDTSWLALARARADIIRAQVKAVVEPKWVAFAGAARALGGDTWRRFRGIKHPRNVREAAVWGGWLAAGGVALVVGFFFFVTWGMPSTDDLWEARNGQSITFLDRNGHVILREGAQNAPPVDLGSLPPYVGQAFIAIEDRRFHEHFGVDFGGMMRAGAENFRAGRVVQGGSTITQQLAKNLFLTNERSWRRKAQEIAMAIWLETRFTKDEILALYLSRVYFGAGAYGVEAAAERYFDRPARELTLLQSAMIAGLVKAPSRLNPARQDIDAARDRAETVLNEMVSLGFIGDAERSAALQEELVISRRNPAGVLSYYRDWIDPLLNEIIGTQRDDFIVETTLDIAAQRAGAEAVEAVLAEQGEPRRVGQAALVALDDAGGVRAMVGGRDYDQSQFNRATQARRQPGSSFKYFIYLAAMENGLTPWSVREDAPITIGDWTPGNYEEEYHGPTELARAFQFSYNMVAIRVAHEVGGQSVIDVARRLGVRSPLEPYDSLALGAQEITLMEMTQAFGAMAADGYNVEPHGVARIRRGSEDETMWSWRQTARARVIEEQPMRYMNYMMRRVVDAGTGTHARIPGRAIGGKTGTGNDYRDAWFVGFTPGLVAGVWAGNDNFAETARVTGGSLPADIWARFMAVALRNTPAREMQMPRPDDYDVGLPDPQLPTLTAVGAPIGAGIGPPPPTPPDDQDRSLDFGPEG
ncbi:MAG: PBP1A family penicillin-binding protein [Terricaulis sp.]